MSSYWYGKNEVTAWIRRYFRRNAEILDVGACDGIWRDLLPEYPNIDAVEAWAPNADRLRGYRHVYRADVRSLPYGEYDLIIFGDVIEHMSVADAQIVLEYAAPRCRDMIVAVPYRFPQGAKDGNPYEVHIQDDLTPEIFAARYPGLAVLYDTGRDYCYYHKGGGAE